MTPSPPSTPLRRSRWRWPKRIASTLLLIAVIAVVGHWYWGHRADVRLDETIARYKAAGEPMLPGDLADPPLPDEQNAVVALRAAAETASLVTLSSEAYDRSERVGFPLKPTEIETLKAFVDERGGATSLVHGARVKPGVAWKLEIRSPIILTLQLDDLKHQRRLQEVLGAAVVLHHHTGDDAAAVRTIQDMLFVSRALERQPNFVSHLVALGLRSVAIDRIELIAPDLRVHAASVPWNVGTPVTRENLRALIDEVLDVKEVIDGQKRGWRAERVQLIDTARALVAGRIASGRIAGSGATGLGTRVNGYLLKPLLLDDASKMSDVMAQGILGSQAPDLPSANLLTPDSIDAAFGKYRPLHPLAGILPSIRRGNEQTFRLITESRLAAVTLAMRWYAADHDGKYPPRLEDLIPAYLPLVPLDAMSAGRPLKYLSGGNPVVYSVGSNGVDDGGSEALIHPGRDSRYDEWEMLDRVLHLDRQPRVSEPAP